MGCDLCFETFFRSVPNVVSMPNWETGGVPYSAVRMKKSLKI